MGIAALIVWIIAAAGGFVLLGTWIAKSGQRPGASNFPPGVIFSHFGLAAAGLVLWIIYLVTSVRALAWIALAAVVVIALLGFTMFVRWIPTCRARMGRPAARGAHPAHGARPEPTADGASRGAGAGTAVAAAPSTSIAVTDLAEGHFPVPVVVGHGLLAVATLVLVLLTALAI